MIKSPLPPALEVKGLWAGYNHRPVLKGVDLSAQQGEIVGIIGPNGSGKSTLFKAVLGLVKPWKGEALVLGRPGAEQRTAIGYMPQMETVNWDFPVTVFDVALMGRYGSLGLFRRPSQADRQATAAALRQVDIEDLQERLIGELSGGQRRRALLARALAGAPRVLFLDEPIAGLDATAQHQFIEVLRSLRDAGTSVVMSTHDLSCVSMACDRAACLQGRILAYGRPEDVLTEKVLSETFGVHLLTVHRDAHAYAYQHHTDTPPAEEKREQHW